MKLSLGALALGVYVAAQAAAPVINNIAMVPRLTIQSDLGITNQIQYTTDAGPARLDDADQPGGDAKPLLVCGRSRPAGTPPLLPGGGVFDQRTPPTDMVLIPAGSFIRGDTFADAEGDRRANCLRTRSL